MRMILLFLFTLCGCATTGFTTPLGFSLVNMTKQSGALGYDNGKETKEGRACAYNILGFLSFGDSSFSQAKQDAGISRILYSDLDIINVLGTYGRVCTIVTGM